MAQHTKENPAVGATGSNQVLRENNSWIVAALCKLPEAMFAVGIGCWLAVGTFELTRWLGGSQ